VDNKVYTYAYYHDGFNGADPGLGQANATGYGANNVPGQKMNMNYRSTGDLLRLSKDMGSDKLDFGAWVDYQTNNRMQAEVDFTLGGALDSTAGKVGAIDRLMTDSLTTIQPYVQYEWKATDALTVTPGLKYVSFNRKLDATVNQGSNNGALSSSQTWTKALPAVTAHYKIQPNWTAYAQAAKGMLAPNLNSFYPKTANGTNDVSTLTPEQTTSLQLGTTWVGDSLTVSGDIYSVDFSNKITSSSCGINTCFSNAGGVKYNGIEGEATYVVGAGFSVYGNYAINNYTKSAGGNIQNAPKSTAAAGVIYNQGPAYASLIAKEVGTRYSGTDINGKDIPMSSYTVVNFATSYKIGNFAAPGKSTKIGFQVNNLFNNNSVYASFANDANGVPMLYALPTRSYMVNLSVDM
jgi:iron complex outermembrane receptor protein